MSERPAGERRLQQRQCLLCRQRADKESMLRLAVDDQGQLWPDLLQKAPGRGVYLCMEPACLATLSDKRLGALKRHFSVALPQAELFRERLGDALRQQLLRLFTQHRSIAAVGRDAVMHQMWKNAPLLLFLAADAGEALVRQVRDAVEKRRASGAKTVLFEGLDAGFLATAFDREKVSVAALDRTTISPKLPRLALWLVRVTGSNEDLSMELEG